MKLESVVKTISEEMGIPLECQNLTVYTGKGKSSLQFADVFHQGEYYGHVVLSTDKNGDREYCAYSGNHPVLAETVDWRESLGLHIQRDEKGEFRVDSNPAPFLGWDVVDPKKLSREEYDRRAFHWVGFGAVSCHFLNQRRKRQYLQKKEA